MGLDDLTNLFGANLKREILPEIDFVNSEDAGGVSLKNAMEIATRWGATHACAKISTTTQDSTATHDYALLSTADFITPVVDDPFDYGVIAATNSLSDIYAMGGRPVSALNLFMWDKERVSKEVAQAILAGGMEAMNAAGVALLGGHSIADLEQKYGLSVNGIVRRDKVWRNNTAQIGDVVVLTKPIGVGILTTALKNDALDYADAKEAVESMKTLNKTACEIAQNFDIRAATDITGFGLLGHLYEMTERAKSLRVFTKSVPILPKVAEMLALGMVPGGSKNNKAFLEKFVEKKFVGEDIVFYDAQTSGGLALALPATQADDLLLRLNDSRIPAAIIAEFVPRKEKAIILE